MKELINHYMTISCFLVLGSCCNANKYGNEARQAWMEYRQISPFERPAEQIDFNRLAIHVRAVESRHPDTFVSNHLNRVADWCQESQPARVHAKRMAEIARSNALLGRDAVLDVGEEVGQFASDHPSGSLGREVDGKIWRGGAWVVTEIYANSESSAAFARAMEPHKEKYRALIGDEAYLSREFCIPISEALQFQMNQISDQ